MDHNPLACYLALEYKALDERLKEAKIAQENLRDENKLLRAEINHIEDYHVELELRMGAMEATIVQLLNYYPLGTKEDTIAAMNEVIHQNDYLNDDLHRLIDEANTTMEEDFDWGDWFPEVDM